MPDTQQIYASLAARFVPFKDLLDIPIVENADPMVDVSAYGLTLALQDSQLPPSTSDKLILRKKVCEKLREAQKLLQTIKPGYILGLTYAYRSMDIQKSSFEKMKKELGFGDRTDFDAFEATHHFIAVPEVAGHPTGGAVDLLIRDVQGNTLDFGTPMHALEKESYAYCPFISDQATLNRKLLRLVMQQAGFAPYDGEWWHFSYGDREWAAYYGEKSAFYRQLSEAEIGLLAA